MKRDLIDIEKWTPHRFPIIIVLNLLLTGLWTWLVMSVDYRWIKDFIMKSWYEDNHLPIYLRSWPLWFELFHITNNLYQVYAHIFTGIKFLGYRHVVPLGSDENQTVSDFTKASLFDILGWVTIYIYYGHASLFPALLGAFHFSSWMISVFFDRSFHEYIIGIGSKNVYWTLFRTSFVFTDGIVRGYMTYISLK
jgi:hypothetical protein